MQVVVIGSYFYCLTLQSSVVCTYLFRTG